MQRLQFVPPWLTPRHTSTHRDSILTSLYEKLSQLSQLEIVVPFFRGLLILRWFRFLPRHQTMIVIWCKFVPSSLEKTRNRLSYILALVLAVQCRDLWRCSMQFRAHVVIERRYFDDKTIIVYCYRACADLEIYFVLKCWILKMNFRLLSHSVVAKRSRDTLKVIRKTLTIFYRIHSQQSNTTTCPDKKWIPRTSLITVFSTNVVINITLCPTF